MLPAVESAEGKSADLACWVGVLRCRLNGLPLYGAAVSSGSAFLLKMPQYVKVGWGWRQAWGRAGWLASHCAAQYSCIARPGRSMLPPRQPQQQQHTDRCLTPAPAGHCTAPPVCTAVELLQFDGIISEALGVEPSVWMVDRTLGGPQGEPCKHPSWLPC